MRGNWCHDYNKFPTINFFEWIDYPMRPLEWICEWQRSNATDVRLPHR